MEIRITVLAKDTAEAFRVIDTLKPLEAAGPFLTSDEPVASAYMQQPAPAQPQQSAQGYTMPQDYAHTMTSQQPAFMQQPVPQQFQQPAFMQQPAAQPAYQQPAFMQQPAAPQPQGVYAPPPYQQQLQASASVPQQPPAGAPTSAPDYTHEQLGRAMAAFCDKAAANREKVLACLKAQGVDAITALATPAQRGAFAAALRQLGVQI